jgi:hypothetical protein
MCLAESAEKKFIEFPKTISIRDVLQGAQSGYASPLLIFTINTENNTLHRWYTIIKILIRLACPYL